ncbi:MAG: nitrogen fixation NifU-like protein [Lysobacterales bacterium]
MPQHEDQQSREQLWKEIIIDHNQFPRCHGRVENPSHEGRGENPFCGDRVNLQIKLDDEGCISDIGFEATGCAISLSSASLLSANVAGKNRDQAIGIFNSVRDLLTKGDEQKPDDLKPHDLGELEALALVRKYPARVKCASLVWHVLKNALEDGQDVATTE